jgi:hypothetical protein
MKTEMKLELESIYKEYCNSNLEGLRGEDEFIDMLFGFIKFRLHVSGGSETTMGDIGCESVNGFLNEIFLFESMISDWSGCYRGDLCYECFDELKGLLDNSSLEVDIKVEILEGYRKYYNMDEE